MRIALALNLLSIRYSQSSDHTDDFGDYHRETILGREDVEGDLDWSEIQKILLGEATQTHSESEDVDSTGAESSDGEDASLSHERHSNEIDDFDPEELRSRSSMAASEADIAPFRDCQQFNVVRGSSSRPDAEDYRVNCQGRPPVQPLTPGREVTVYFIRHAESVWNEVTESNFGKKILLESTRGKAIGFEALTDAHLSDHGLKGALSVNKALNSNCQDRSILRCDDAKFLAGNPDALIGRKAIFATSNLRRAILTALITFKDRILAARGSPEYIEDMHILSLMQEITGNSDSIPVTMPEQIPWLSFSKPGGQLHSPRSSSKSDADLDSPRSQNASPRESVISARNIVIRTLGSLSLKRNSPRSPSPVDRRPDEENRCPFPLRRAQTLFAVDCENQDENHPKLHRGRKILEGFCEWMRLQAARDPGLTDFVLTGHSIWIRKFFQKFFEKSDAGMDNIAAQVRSSTQKMSNEAILKFTIEFDLGKRCIIVPGETSMVRGTIKPRHR